MAGALTKFPRWLTLSAADKQLLDLSPMPSKNVTLRQSDLGKGVYALCHFAADEQVGEISGRVIEDPDYSSEYCMECGDGQSLEAAAPFRFLNHNCDPNCELIIWEGDSPGDWDLCLHTIKAIEPGEELTIDYAWPVDAAIPCLCRSEQCRGWIVAETELPFVQEA